MRYFYCYWCGLPVHPSDLQIVSWCRCGEPLK